jgi:hypothetical protein
LRQLGRKLAPTSTLADGDERQTYTHCALQIMKKSCQIELQKYIIFIYQQLGHKG